MTHYYTKLTYLDGREEYYYMDAENFWRAHSQFCGPGTHIEFSSVFGPMKGFHIVVLKVLLRSFAGRCFGEDINELRIDGENQDVQ